MKQQNKEIRNIGDIQSMEECRHITGYAVVFNSQSEDMGFYETITPEAITEDTIKRSDIVCLYNHNEDRGILARSRYGKGSLKLSVDARGLKYEFDAPKTALGDELLEMIRRGDINQSSFAFTIAEGGYKWEKRDGKYYHTITNIDRLFDVSPVITPAYKETSVANRSLEDFKEKMKYIENLEKEIESIDFHI